MEPLDILELSHSDIDRELGVRLVIILIIICISYIAPFLGYRTVVHGALQLLF